MPGNKADGYNMKKTMMVTFLFFLILFTAASCSKAERVANGNVFELDTIDLTGKSYAMIFSANMWNEVDMKYGRNVLLLIDDEGNWDAYTTYNLDRANVNWTEDGLYFSDYKYEYFISNEGKIQKSKKTTDLKEGTAQDGSSIDDEGGVWSWFDIGFSKNGYDTRITYQYKGKQKEFMVEGVYSYFFTVGTELYGVTSSFDLPNGINKGGHLGLVKFVGDDLTPIVLSSYPLPSPEVEPIDISQQVVQYEDEVYVIGEAEVIGDEFQTNLMKWNVHDGSFELGRIAVPIDHYGNELSTFAYYTDQEALIDRELYWFNERVELMKTNVDTFETEFVQSYDVHVQDEMFYIARFVNNQVFIIVNDTTWGNSFEREGTKMKLIKTNLTSPEKYITVEIPEGEQLAEMFSYGSLSLSNNSFAVRPIISK